MTTKAKQLRKLIDQETYEEKACQTFLPDIALHLVPFRIQRESIIATGREERSRVGDSDFSISITVDNGAFGRRYAYVWEVKAPQCYLFEQDTANNRLRPTAALYSAENQLLNYVAELTQSTNFRHKFGLEGISDEVKPGGIIIGRKDRLVQPSTAPSATQEGLARAAYVVRDAYLWSHAGIRVHTWDWVCEQLEHLTWPTNVQGSIYAGIATSTPLPINTTNLIAFAQQTLSSASDEIAMRSAVMSAYSAVELKLIPGGWNGRPPTPRDVVQGFLTPRVPHDQEIKLLFSRLTSIRNQAVHQFDRSLTAEDASYAVRTAAHLIELIDLARAAD